MADALIGFSGYVGSTLLKQRYFQSLYRSANIADIRGQRFELVVCAGAPAQKWVANRDPATDLENVKGLIAHLDSVRCSMFVLISTVDVFKVPVDVDEATPVDEAGLHPYGLHRRLLERAVQERFPDHLIVRLPGLVGPGLRKNVIFDFLNDNLGVVDSRAEFQFYPMVNLWYDIAAALREELRLLHLAAAPISVAEAALEGFGRTFTNTTSAEPIRYDFQSRHAALFGGQGKYQYSKREALQAIRSYAQSEPLTLAGKGGRS